LIPAKREVSLETIPDSDTGLMKFVASDKRTVAKRNKLKEEERRVNEYRILQAREKTAEEKRRKNDYDLQQQHLWKAQVEKIFIKNFTNKKRRNKCKQEKN